MWITSFPPAVLFLRLVFLLVCRMMSAGRVPRHVGFVMDGNRTYARRRRQQQQEGHAQGFEAMQTVLETCYLAGVSTATVYGFSIENFKRPAPELHALMALAKTKMAQVTAKGELCERHGIRVRVLGDMSLLDADVVRAFREAEDTTRHNTRATLNVCWAYTARDDITKAIRRAAASGSGSSAPLALSTSDDPPLDLLVRTSGQRRLSDFLLWEATQGDTTIELLDVLWPQFTPWHMLWVLFRWGYGHRGAST